MIRKYCFINHRLVSPIFLNGRTNVILYIVLLPLLIASSCLPSISSASSREYKKPEDVVAWLYRDFSWEATMAGQFLSESLIEEPKEILSMYFSDELVTLIIQERSCVKTQHELCNLDFDPIFVSQDPSAVDITIATAGSSNTVHVYFRYASNQKRVDLDFKVEKTKRGWRISNILYGNGKSLQQILKGNK